MKQLYLKLTDNLNIIIYSLKCAMQVAHLWNLQGLKRKYRYYAVKLFMYKGLLHNELFDDHQEVLGESNTNVPRYDPKDIDDHMQRWSSFMASQRDTNAQIIADITAKKGKQSSVAVKILNILYKEAEKAFRMNHRWDLTDHSMHDLLVQDCKIHKKFKKKESK